MSSSLSLLHDAIIIIATIVTHSINIFFITSLCLLFDINSLYHPSIFTALTICGQ